MSDSQQSSDQNASERIRRRRSIAIAWTLGVMVVAFYVATFIRLGGG